MPRNIPPYTVMKDQDRASLPSHSRTAAQRQTVVTTVPNLCIRAAEPQETGATQALIRTTIALHPTDPNLESFRHELATPPSPNERFTEYVALIDGKLAGRCKINFRTQAEDIDAYGPTATKLHSDEQMGALTSDLVAPDFRGLGVQNMMIQHRLTLLKDLGFTYAVCGIIIGNQASEINYLRHGFTPIGAKDIDWGKNAVGERIKRVTLYGLNLRKLASPTPRLQNC